MANNGSLFFCTQLISLGFSYIHAEYAREEAQTNDQRNEYKMFTSKYSVFLIWWGGSNVVLEKDETK